MSKVSRTDNVAANVLHLVKTAAQECFGQGLAGPAFTAAVKRVICEVRTGLNLPCDDVHLDSFDDSSMKEVEVALEFYRSSFTQLTRMNLRNKND